MKPQTVTKANRAANFLGWFSIGLGSLEAVAPGALGRTLGLGQMRLLRLYGLRELGAGVSLLTQPNPVPWLWARVAGDALDIVTLVGALTPGNSRRRNAGVALASVLAITGLDLWTAVQLTRLRTESRHPNVQKVEG
ncbi:hypothetical protein [Deinococcus altitudinis]|uniref:hypothetical protein n=1 Tax=Deinococcus altitudinis TaxID=468914 RepID=UPI00389221BD